MFIHVFTYVRQSVKRFRAFHSHSISSFGKTLQIRPEYANIIIYNFSHYINVRQEQLLLFSQNFIRYLSCSILWFIYVRHLQLPNIFACKSLTRVQVTYVPWPFQTLLLKFEICNFLRFRFTATPGIPRMGKVWDPRRSYNLSCLSCFFCAALIVQWLIKTTSKENTVAYCRHCITQHFSVWIKRFHTSFFPRYPSLLATLHFQKTRKE